MRISDWSSDVCSSDLAATVTHPGLPALRTRVIGRTETIALLAGHFDTHSFLTIVGPGGIGKPTVAAAALAAEEHREDGDDDRLWWPPARQRIRAGGGNADERGDRAHQRADGRTVLPTHETHPSYGA